MSKKKQAAKRFAHETLDAGYQYKDLGDNTFALVDAKGKRYNVKDAGLEANKSGIANLFTPNRRQRILNARALARAAALKGATKAEPKAFIILHNSSNNSSNKINKLLVKGEVTAVTKKK